MYDSEKGKQLCMSLTAPLLVHVVSDGDTHMAPSPANDVFSSAHLFIHVYGMIFRIVFRINNYRSLTRPLLNRSV